MLQEGQVFRLRGGGDEKALWAFRDRAGGRGSRRVQRGGFASQRDASEALERAERPVKQEEIGSPLTDSNRRPPPYHPFSRSTDSLPIAVCVRSAP